MTIEADTVSYSYVGNGATTVFPFPSRFLAPADLTVSLDGVAQSTGYTIAGAGNQGGGTVTIATAPATGVVVNLTRDPAISQLTHFVDGASTLAGTLEGTIDKLTMIAQAQKFRETRDKAALSALIDAERTARINAIAALPPAAPYGAGSVLVRGAIPSVTIPVETFRTVDGAPWIRGTSTGPMAIADKSGQYWVIDVSDTVHPSWFGAVGDTNTDDTAAWQRAVTSGARSVRSGSLPAGRYYNVHELWVPDNVTIEAPPNGVPLFRTATLKPDGVSKWDFVIRLGAACSLRGVSVSGNNCVNKGISVSGDSVDVTDLSVQYCYFGTYNEGRDLTNYINVNYSQCDYGHYNYNRGITVNFNMCRFYALRISMLFTYTDQQPQTTNVTHCQFESCQYGIWADKDIYDMSVTHNSFDGMTMYGMYMLNPLLQGMADIRIRDNYFSCNLVCIYFGPGAYHISITGNGINDSTGGLVIFAASATARSTQVDIDDNVFGTCGTQSILADSVANLTIAKNRFSPTFAAPMNAPVDIVANYTYTAGPNPRGLVQGNFFVKSHPINAAANVRCVANENFVTEASGIVTFPGSSGTSSIFAHGMHPDAPPVSARAPGFNASPAGYTWTEFNSAQATARSSGSPATGTQALVELKSAWS